MDISLKDRLRQKISDLEAELMEVRKDLEDLDRLEQRYPGQTTLDLSLNPSAYKDIKLKDAVKKVLLSCYPEPMRAKTIAHEIREGGYPTKSSESNFAQGLGFLLGKLAKSQEVEKIDTGLYKARLEQ